jgi:hypothetical protein
MSQLSLFEDSPAVPKAYVPKQEHVRNHIESLHTALRDAEEWPWEPVMVALHRERTLPYLYGLLSDENEAREWRARIEAEIVRLDAAAQTAAISSHELAA